MTDRKFLIYLLFPILGGFLFYGLSILAAMWLINLELFQLDVFELYNKGVSAAKIQELYYIKEFKLYSLIFILAALPIAIPISFLSIKEALISTSITMLFAVGFMEILGFYNLIIAGKYPWLYGIFIFAAMLLLVVVLNILIRTLTNRSSRDRETATRFSAAP